MSIFHYKFISSLLKRILQTDLKKETKKKNEFLYKSIWRIRFKKGWNKFIMENTHYFFGS